VQSVFSHLFWLLPVFTVVTLRRDQALKQVQIERPAYASGAPDWWGEVIKRTALGAGADPTRECHNLIEPTKPPGLEGRASNPKLTTSTSLR